MHRSGLRPWETKMEVIQDAVAKNLMAMFPMRPPELILQCVTHPRNCYQPVTEEALLNRCIDDLLSDALLSDDGPEDAGLAGGGEQDADNFATFQDIVDMLEPLNCAKDPTVDQLSDVSEYDEVKVKDEESDAVTSVSCDRTLLAGNTARSAAAADVIDLTLDSPVKVQEPDYEEVICFNSSSSAEIEKLNSTPAKHLDSLKYAAAGSSNDCVMVTPSGNSSAGNCIQYNKNELRTSVPSLSHGLASAPQPCRGMQPTSRQAKPATISRAPDSECDVTSNAKSSSTSSAATAITQPTASSSLSTGVRLISNGGTDETKPRQATISASSAVIGSSDKPLCYPQGVPSGPLLIRETRNSDASTVTASATSPLGHVQVMPRSSTKKPSSALSTGVNGLLIPANQKVGQSACSTSTSCGPTRSLATSSSNNNYKVLLAQPVLLNQAPRNDVLVLSSAQLVSSATSLMTPTLSKISVNSQMGNGLALQIVQPPPLSNVQLGPAPAQTAGSDLHKQPGLALRSAPKMGSSFTVVNGTTLANLTVGLQSTGTNVASSKAVSKLASASSASATGNKNAAAQAVTAAPRDRSVPHHGRGLQATGAATAIHDAVRKLKNAGGQVHLRNPDARRNSSSTQSTNAHGVRAIATVMTAQGHKKGQSSGLHKQLHRTQPTAGHRPIAPASSRPAQHPAPRPIKLHPPNFPPLPPFPALQGGFHQPAPMAQATPAMPPLPAPAMPPMPAPAMPPMPAPVMPPMPPAMPPIPAPVMPPLPPAMPPLPPPADVLRVQTSQDNQGHPVDDINAEDQSTITSLQLQEVKKLFPDADEAYVRSKLVEFRFSDDPVNFTCNHLLENVGFPRSTSSKSSQDSKKATKGIDYIKDWNNRGLIQNYHQYFNQGLDLLSNEFRKISRTSLRLAMHTLFRGCYAKTRKALDDAIKSDPAIQIKLQDNSRGSIFYIKGDDGRQVEIRLLKKARPPSGFGSLHAGSVHPELQKEIDFYKDLLKNENEKADFEVALRLNEDQYEKEGQLIECGCCYMEVTFEDMVQCLEGHLFCQTCLRRYANEAAFGQGKATLSCLEDGCDGVFPRSQLEKTLPRDILDKYDERVVEESINQAEVDNLLRCPHCNYAAVLDANHKVFSCPECRKETCRECKEPWKDHFGLACDELKKQSKMRLSYQERMTEAKVRTCYKCAAKFTKSEGCNKMTCRCGAIMCYICRAPIKDYSHFNNKGRPPGGQSWQPHPPGKCLLWTNDKEDDDRAIKEIEKEMKEEERLLRAKSGTAADNKRHSETGPEGVGVSSAKRPRTS